MEATFTNEDHLQSINTLRYYLGDAAGFLKRKKHGLAPIMYAEGRGTVYEINYIWSRFMSLLQENPHFSLEERDSARNIYNNLEDLTRRTKQKVKKYPGLWTKFMHTFNSAISFMGDYRQVVRIYLATYTKQQWTEAFPDRPVEELENTNAFKEANRPRRYYP